MVRQLAGCEVVRRIETDEEDAWVLLCADRSGIQKLAAWSTDSPLTVELALEDVPFEAVSLIAGLGNTIDVSSKQGRLVLELDALPQYVTGRKRSTE